MSEYKPYIDEDGRLHLFSICDGTLIFLQGLINNLKRLCCRDIDHSTTILAEGFPEDKPWMNCLFEASGKLPWYLWPGARIIEMSDGGYGILGPEELTQRENRYQDSACYEWSKKMFDDSVSAYIRKLVGKEKTKMKAITIRQPWATLTVSLDRNGRSLKKVETRSWKTSYRGPLAIHAGKTVPDMFFMGMKESDMDEFFSVGLYGDKSILCLPYGSVIGKVTLVDCVPIEQLYGGSLDTARERAFGDWEPGRYGWILANPIRYMDPIPARGKQGIWEWEEPIGWMTGKGETVKTGDSGKLI